MGLKFKGYKNEKQPVVILGSDMNGVDVSSEVAKSLKSLGFAFKEVVGSYEHVNGEIVNEKSFVVPYDESGQDYLALHGLAEHFGQESILRLTKDRTAILQFIDRTNGINLGKFTPLTMKQFELLDEKYKKSYTFDGSYYYVTIKE
jgi:hypothetical protein